MDNLLNHLENIISNIPMNSDINNIYEIIQNNLNNTNIQNISNNDDYVQFNIEITIIDSSNNVIENEEKKFKSYKEINEKLGKSFRIKQNEDILNETCFICIDNYKEKELKRILPNCNHCFHKKCIDKWLLKKSNCPICRNHLI